MNHKSNPNKLPPGLVNLRKGRKSTNNAAYFVTFNTYNRRKISISNDIYKLFLEKVHWLEDNGYARVYCLVLMPDHVHIVFRLTGQKNLSHLIHSIKSYLSNRINRILCHSGKLWQSGFFDYRIRNNSRFMQVIYYCYMNPNKKNVCSYDSIYKYWYCKKEIWDQLKKEMEYLKKLENMGLGFYPLKLLSTKN